MNDNEESLPENPWDDKPRTSLPQELSDELERRALDPSDCIRLTLVPHQGLDRQRESIRPTEIAGAPVWQLERRQGKQVLVENFHGAESSKKAIRSMLAATGAREYHLSAAKGDLHVRITRKGRALVTRGRPEPQNEVVARPHDREKDLPLSRFDSSALLRAIGIADGSDRIKATMRGKFDQINAFLRELDSVLDEEPHGASRPLTMLDCGCGRAYLTLSAAAYLRSAKGMEVHITGVDRNAEIIAKCSQLAQSLGMGDCAQFIAADLADYKAQSGIDLLLSLHACDTATDLALAAGIRSGARRILAAPCCQHDIQKQLRDTGRSSAIMRQSILRERLADILTDAFRAQALRICGYRTRVVEFVSQEATARNIMIRAISGLKPGQPGAVGEYLALEDEWKVKPAIEGILGEGFSKLLRS